MWNPTVVKTYTRAFIRATYRDAAERVRRPSSEHDADTERGGRDQSELAHSGGPRAQETRQVGEESSQRHPRDWQR